MVPRWKRRYGNGWPMIFEIRVVTAAFFVATKLEAFKGRGKGDFFGSRDLEDLISVVDGRATLVAEIQVERPMSGRMFAPRLATCWPRHVFSTRCRISVPRCG